VLDSAERVLYHQVHPLKMWWVRGHQVSKLSVKTLNARARVALTTTDFRTLVSNVAVEIGGSYDGVPVR
jgi:hypothetical protein